MAISITAFGSTPVTLEHCRLSAGAITINGGDVHIEDVRTNTDVVVTNGDLRIDNCEVGGDLEQSGGNLYGSNLWINGNLALTGGDELFLDQVRVDGGGSAETPAVTVDDTGDEYGEIDLKGILAGHLTSASKTNLVVLTALLGARIDITALRASETGIIIDSCTGCDITARVKATGTGAHDTHPAIELIDSHDIDLRGSVRAGTAYGAGANRPNYGVDVDADCTAIDLWMAITGPASGEINDQTTGEVTVH